MRYHVVDVYGDGYARILEGSIVNVDYGIYVGEEMDFESATLLKEEYEDRIQREVDKAAGNGGYDYYYDDEEYEYSESSYDYCY